MIDGYIDSASTYEVVVLLSFNDPADAYMWAWQGALTTSAALINCSHLKMAPGPTPSGAASGSYGKLTLALAALITHVRPDAQVQTDALLSTKEFADAHIPEIRAFYKTIKTEDAAFPGWLDWAVHRSWREHSPRLGGLFDPQFIPPISRILQVEEDYLTDIHRLSCDPAHLNHYARDQLWDTDEFRVMADAYLISALLRGYYHDCVARGSSLQIIHHPLRQTMLAPATTRDPMHFTVSNTEDYLSKIILGSAFTQRRHTDRISRWADNILAARQAALTGGVDLRPKEYDDIALASAVKAAKQLDIRVDPSWLEPVIDAAIAVGFGVLTTFVLDGWPALLAIPVDFAIFRQLKVGERAAKLTTRTDRRLRELATSPPGRVGQIWHK